MSATPPTKAIVNPTLVGVSAGGAAGGARTRSGGGLVQTDAFRVSANRDAAPTRKRLPRAAAGDAAPGAIVPRTTGATETELATPRRRRSGPSARKRKEARATPQVPEGAGEAMGEEPIPAAAEEEPFEEPAQEANAQEAEDDDRTTTPEVSEDEAAAPESDDEGVEGGTYRQATHYARGGAKGPPPATVRREPGEGVLPPAARNEPSSPEYSEDDEFYAFADLGTLNHLPGSVGFIFARQAERERLAGLDVAAQVWATTKQLLGEGTSTQKLSAALAASKQRAYLVVMKGDRFFTLIHHLSMLDVELRPQDPIIGKLVAFESEVIHGEFPPRLVVLEEPPRDLFTVMRPQMGARDTINKAYMRAGPGDKKFLGVRRRGDEGGDDPVATTRLIPIPMAWGAYFLDNPSFGVALRRMYRLVDAVPRLERCQFAPLIDSLILACYGDRQDDKSSHSFLSSEWETLRLSQRTKAWMQDRWATMTADDDEDMYDGDASDDPEDDRKLPAYRAPRVASPQNPPFPSRVRPASSASGPSPKRVRQGPAPTPQARTRAVPVPTEGVATATTLPPPPPAALTMADIGPLLSEILKAQAESTLHLHQILPKKI